jgi:adenylate kinase family enzyme
VKRVIVLGSGGSGKSTFSTKLAKETGLPLVHLDRLFWKSGWVIPDKEEWHKELINQVQQEEWVMDGNYGSTIDLRLERADTVILFDYVPLLCLYRVLKRRIMYHKKTRPDMGEGCEEKIDFEFIIWVWSFRKKKIPDLLNKIENKKGIQFHHFKKPKDAEDYLKKCNIKEVV